MRFVMYDLIKKTYINFTNDSIHIMTIKEVEYYNARTYTRKELMNRISDKRIAILVNWNKIRFHTIALPDIIFTLDDLNNRQAYLAKVSTHLCTYHHMDKLYR